MTEKQKQLNEIVINKVCTFAFNRCGKGKNGDKWKTQMYFISPLDIAQLYLEEFVRWEDMQIHYKKEFPN